MATCGDNLLYLELVQRMVALVFLVSDRYVNVLIPFAIICCIHILKRRRLCDNVIFQSCPTVVILDLPALGCPKWYMLQYNAASGL